MTASQKNKEAMPFTTFPVRTFLIRHFQTHKRHRCRELAALHQFIELGAFEACILRKIALADQPL